MTTIRLGMTLAMMVATMTIAACGQKSAPSTAADAALPLPDISGVWGARVQGSLADDPPFLPEALAVFNARQPEDDPIVSCKPPGIPRLMNLAFAMEIVQTPQIVYFLMEYGQAVRRVHIDGTHPQDLEPGWFGHSVGHWEGRTLVVDTVGFNDASWLDIRGHQHSDALHVIERFTLLADGKELQYEVAIDDPKTYSRPWQSVTKTFPRRPELQIQEFLCEV